MGLLAFLRTWWKPLAILALMVGSWLGGWVTNGWRLGKQAAEAEASQAKADLTEFKKQADRLSGISNSFEQAAVTLRDAGPKIIERYTRVEVQSPLPAGCRIDDGRMQHINAAERAANAAGQPGAAVPADPRDDQR